MTRGESRPTPSVARLGLPQYRNFPDESEILDFAIMSHSSAVLSKKEGYRAKIHHANLRFHELLIMTVNDALTRSPRQRNTLQGMHTRRQNTTPFILEHSIATMLLSGRNEHGESTSPDELCHKKLYNYA
ncbi:jg2389 [Pararge aegeria aegeria]|uniref:Jg2389 protein n=1 Tax=Pararge aegeria aegeria TaxID=348720 RepID=A0A8S4S5I9_9NEOP|nr:jg2389 [Pararge aegeria aegeria]